MNVFSWSAGVLPARIHAGRMFPRGPDTIAGNTKPMPRLITLRPQPKGAAVSQPPNAPGRKIGSTTSR
jgi:hypothetical protein